VPDTSGLIETNLHWGSLSGVAQVMCLLATRLVRSAGMEDFPS
jgi:hypothetical protein